MPARAYEVGTAWPMDFGPEVLPKIELSFHMFVTSR